MGLESQAEDSGLDVIDDGESLSVHHGGPLISLDILPIKM